MRSKIKNENNETLKAGCVILNDKKEVLLVISKGQKTWAFPKGHAEHGETLEQAALREVKEETGYDVALVKRLSDVTYAHGQTGELIRVAIFLAKPIKLSGKPEKKMHSMWVSISKARNILYHDLVFLLDQLD